MNGSPLADTPPPPGAHTEQGTVATELYLSSTLVLPTNWATIRGGAEKLKSKE